MANNLTEELKRKLEETKNEADSLKEELKAKAETQKEELKAVAESKKEELRTAAESKKEEINTKIETAMNEIEDAVAQKELPPYIPDAMAGLDAAGVAEVSEKIQEYLDSDDGQ